MSTSQAYLKLNTGYSIPQLGLGTWQSQPNEIGSAIDHALKVGYRHIDCAYAYENQAEIGTTLGKNFSQDVVKRSDLFITSKVWNAFHSYQMASQNIDKTLKDLQLPYMDMCLIHWPMGYFEGGADLFPMKDGAPHYSDVDYLDTWKAMEDAVTAGKIKSIGLSNFSIPQMQRVLKEARIKPSNLQVEVHPYLTQSDLIDWCKSNGIVVCAYSPLANPGSVLRKPGQPNLFNEPLMQNLSAKLSKTIGQLALRWAIQRNIVVIPKSVHKNRIEENFAIWDFELSDNDMKAISELNRNLRLVSIERDSHHPFYPFK